jgi:hypothetical protein
LCRLETHPPYGICKAWQAGGTHLRNFLACCSFWTVSPKVLAALWTSVCQGEGVPHEVGHYTLLANTHL